MILISESMIANMKLEQTAIVIVLALLVMACSSKNNSLAEQDNAIFPVPKTIDFKNGMFCFSDSILINIEDQTLIELFSVLKDELMTLWGIPVIESSGDLKGNIVLAIDSTLKKEEYHIEIDDQVRIIGADYNAIAMGSVTFLQSLSAVENRVCIRKGIIKDQPDLHYRGLSIDLARRRHDLETIKRVVMLCRWYKVNFLQLHLTDDQLFTFPSAAYPKLPTPSAHFTESELTELVAYAHARGVHLVPELDIPGHSSQMITKLPKLFGFTNKQLNRNTINMANEQAYAALDTILGEIARVFHHSEYIHIGGDETDFSGMENDPQVQQYLQQHNLANINELFWYFINRMNESVKKRGRKTIVWEGFSKQANNIINKDITVMAWETKYQLPQDLLAGGFKIINVSWKPLYVVNEKKWDPIDIYKWNVYSWANWVPEMPSYKPFKIPDHPNVIGAVMASWDQDAFIEISSLRMRIPAMTERVWNTGSDMEDSVFLKTLRKADEAFSSYLSPVHDKVDGLTYPNKHDRKYNEHTWFHDSLIISLYAPKNFEIRYTLDGSPVKNTSLMYRQPIILRSTNELRYRAFEHGNQVGAEMFEYYELRPLLVELSGNFTVPLDSLWETTRSWLIGFKDSVKINLTSARKGTIRYSLGEKDLNEFSDVYEKPLVIKDTTQVKAGLFVNDILTGKPWMQHFRKE
jgi:hexosaminidase